MSAKDTIKRPVTMELFVEFLRTLQATIGVIGWRRMSSAEGNTFVTVMVLQFINDLGSVSVPDIAKEHGVGRKDALKLVDKLLDAGLLQLSGQEMTSDDSSPRQDRPPADIEVVITESGQQWLANALNDLERVMRDTLKGLNTKRFENSVSLIQQLNRRLSKGPRPVHTIEPR